MGGNQSLFQLATAAIPTLLFGGAIAARQNSEAIPSSRLLAGLVLLFMAVAVVGEILAIRGLIDPTADRFAPRYVAAVLVLGTIGIAAWTATPWLHDLEPPALAKHWLAQAGMAIALVATMMIAQLALTHSLNLAAAERASRLAEANLQQAKARAEATHEHLLMEREKLTMSVEHVSRASRAAVVQAVLAFLIRTTPGRPSSLEIPATPLPDPAPKVLRPAPPQRAVAPEPQPQPRVTPTAQPPQRKATVTPSPTMPAPESTSPEYVHAPTQAFAIFERGLTQIAHLSEIEDTELLSAASAVASASRRVDAAILAKQAAAQKAASIGR